MSFSYHLGHTTVSRIIPEAHNALWSALQEYKKYPSQPEEWKQIANKFWNLLNLLMCCGAIDGKQLVMQCPPVWSSFHIKSTTSWICQLILCICHWVMHVCHLIICISFSDVYLSFDNVYLSFSYVLIIQWCPFIIHVIIPFYSSFNYGLLPFSYSISIQYWLTTYTWARKSAAEYYHWQALNAWRQQKWHWVWSELEEEKRINVPMWPFNEKMEKNIREPSHCWMRWWVF